MGDVHEEHTFSDSADLLRHFMLEHIVFTSLSSVSLVTLIIKLDWFGLRTVIHSPSGKHLLIEEDATPV
jgi:hypothetical protein